MRCTKRYIDKIIISLLGVLFWSGPLVADDIERFEIETDRKENYLSYYFTEQMFFDHGTTRESVASAVQVYQQAEKVGDSSQIMMAKNGAKSVGEIASILTRDMTELQVLTENPLRMRLKDVTIVPGQRAGDKYLVAAAMASDSAFVLRKLAGIGRYEKLFLTTGVDVSGDGMWSAAIVILAAIDYDRDGSVEVFFSITPGRDIRPRMLACVQIEPFKIEWQREISSVISRGGLYFYPDSANPVVLTASRGPQNGATDDIFDDRFGYFAALDNHGEILYAYKTLANYGHAALAPIDSSNQTFCLFHNLPLTEMQTELFDPRQSWLSLVSVDGTVIKSIEVNSQPVSIWTRHQEKNGPLLIYTLWPDGRIRTFDQQLGPLSVSEPSILTNYQGQLKIAGEAAPAMIFGTRRREVVLYNSSFEMLALYERNVGNFQPLELENGSATKVTMSGGSMGGVLQIHQRDKWTIFLIAFQEEQEFVLTILVLLALSVVISNAFRMRTVTSLRERERTLSTLFDNMQDGFYRTDLEGRLTWASPSCAEMLGGSRDANFIGMKATDMYVDPSKREALAAALKEHGRVNDWEVVIRRTDGCIITLSTNSSFHYDKNGKVAGIEGVFRDVTARKEMEFALKLSEEQYRTLVESAEESIFKVDYDGTYLFMNSIFAKRMGGKAKDFIGRREDELFPPDVAKRHMKHIRAVFETGVGSVADQEGIMNGKYAIHNASLQPIHDNQGKIVAVLGVSRDITELVRTRSSLATQEKFVGSLLDTANSLIACLDLDGKILVFNRELERITGQKRSEVVGKKWGDVIAGSAGACFESWFLDASADNCECSLISNAGTHYTILWSKSAVKTPGFVKSSVLVIGQDITDRKEAELALAHSEESYRLLVQNVTATICLINADGFFEFINEEGAELHGLTSDQIVGKSMNDLFPIEYVEPQMVIVRSVINKASEEIFEVELPIQGKMCWFETTVHPYRDSSGRITAAMIIAEDITEEKDTKEHIRLLLSAVEQSSEGLVVVDLKGNIIVINEAFAGMHGYTPEELKGKHLSLFHTEQHFPAVNQATSQILETGDFNGDIWHVRKDGSEFLGWMNNTLLKDTKGETIGIVGTLVDITDRRRIEEALRESSEKYRGIFNESVAAVFIFDNDKRFTGSNQAGCELLGYSKDELMSLSIPDVDADHEDVKPAHKELLAGGRIVNFEHRLRHKDGRVITVLNNSRALTDAAGVVIGMQSTLIDITDRKRAEETLQYRVQIEELVSSISAEFINMPIGLIDEGINQALNKVGLFLGADRGYLFGLSGDGKYMVASHSWHREGVEAIHGLLEKIPFDALPWWSAKLRVHEWIAISRTSEVPIEAAVEREYFSQSGTKSLLSMPLVLQGELIGLLHISCLYHERDWPTEDIQMLKVIVEVFVNALEHKKKTLEVDRINRERLDQERQIAGGFAHEIRNALFPARGMLEKLAESIDKPDARNDNQLYSKMVDESLTRAMGLVSSIMEYSRLGTQAIKEAVNVAAVINDVLHSNQMRLDNQRVQVDKSGSSKLSIICNTQQLYMVINNILLNALDAVDSIDQPLISISWSVVKDWVKITVVDNGCGMKPKEIDLIFKAFYSTKPDKGTGLGLATVEKIVSMYNGRVEVNSSPGTGTEIILYFEVNQVS